MKPRRRPHRPSRRDVVLVLLLLAIGVVLYSEFVGPIDPYHRAALGTLRSALAELPPYPGSAAAPPAFKAGLIEYQTILLSVYDTDVACADVQTYYVTSAAASGWRVWVLRSTLHVDTTPDHDELHSSYLKRENGFDLELILECFVDSSYQPGYTLILQTPPDSSP
jgi:hypothetical protein